MRMFVITYRVLQGLRLLALQVICKKEAVLPMTVTTSALPSASLRIARKGQVAQAYERSAQFERRMHLMAQ